MNFKQGLNRAWNIIFLNSAAAEETAQDTRATGTAILITILAGVASALGVIIANALFPSPVGDQGMSALSSIIGTPIFLLIALFIWTAILHIMALIFGGKGSFMELFRPLGHSELLLWVSLFSGIPFVGAILSILVFAWIALVINVVCVKGAHGLSTGKAIAAVYIPLVLLGLFAIVLIGALFVTIITAIGGGLATSMR